MMPVSPFESLFPELRDVESGLSEAELRARIAARRALNVVQGWSPDPDAVAAALREADLEAPHLQSSISDSFAWSADIAEQLNMPTVGACLRNAQERYIATENQSDWMNNLDAVQGGFSRLAASSGQAFVICPITGATLSTTHCIPVSSDEIGQVFLFYRFSGVEEFYVIVSGFAATKSHIYFPKKNLIVEAHRPDFAWGSASRMIDEFIYVLLTNREGIESYIGGPTRPAILSATLSNVGHFLWNELSGVYDYEVDGLLESVEVGLIYKHAFVDPFDILDPRLLPERLKAANWLKMLGIVLNGGLFCIRPANTHISAELADRVKRLARERGSQAQRQAISAAQSRPFVLWGALRAHNKVWLNQVEALVLAARMAEEKFGAVALFVDGLPDCHPYYEDLVRQVSPNVQVFCGLDIGVYDTLNWAFSVDAYVATIGSGLTFVTWLAAKPGIAQSERHHLGQLDFWKDVRRDAPAPLAPSEAEVEDVGEGLYGQGMYCNYRIPLDIVTGLVARLLADIDAPLRFGGSDKVSTRLRGQRLERKSSVPHSGRLGLVGDMLQFSEAVSTHPEWQIFSINLPSIARDQLSLTVEVVRDRTTVSTLYLGLNGGRHVGFVDLENLTCFAEEAASLTSYRAGDLIIVNASLKSDDGIVHIGTANEHHEPLHTGDDGRMLTIAAIEVDDQYARGSRPALVVLDVGAAGGIEPMWARFTQDIHFVLVEPDPEAAAELKGATEDLQACTVLATGLAGEDGGRRLFVTRAPFCSSLLPPDMERLASYKVGPVFQTSSVSEVECYRYDTLWERGAPAPDYIKLDTQGTELEILRGFGAVLDSCLAIQLEAHFYPIYKGQPLVGDVVKYLDENGFRLRDLRPCRSFDKDYVEVDCIFTRRELFQDGDPRKGKLEFIEEALTSAGFNMSESDLGYRMARQFT